MGEPESQKDEEQAPQLRPAWSLPAGTADSIALPVEWPSEVTRDWAWGDSTGQGVRVCILDSGVDTTHPLVGEVQRSVAVSIGADDEVVVEDDPDCELVSVRVLGAGFTGSGGVLLAGLRWAIEQGFDVINMSLSTTKKQFTGILHELTDTAYFRRTVLVASAHNMPVESYPWRFSSVISVGSHEEHDPFTFFYNPSPPVEFFARGVDVEVAWMGGARIRCTGNSFATPHMSGLCTLVLAKHPELTPFQLKSVLYLISTNVGGGR